MYARQKQVLESFVRVQTFLASHPAQGSLSYGDAPKTLEDAVRLLREFAGAQVSGRELSRGELRRQEQLITRLKVQHMKPIVAIARTQIEPESDARLPVALRMPSGTIRATRMLQSCDGMIEAAKQFEAVFVANGLPADFLARFSAARDELEGVLGGRAVQVGTHVGARKGLQVQLRRARRAVERLDAVVKATFVNDEPVLAKWRTARRVHLQPGGVGRSGSAPVTLPAAPAPAELPAAA